MYITLGLWGWWNWLRRRQGQPLQVRKTRTSEWWLLVVVGLASTVIIAQILIRQTDSNVPWLDSSTTVLSLLATYGQGRKLLESWWLWILADIIYVPLYAYKGLWLTALLYAGFLVLCVIGLRRWKTAMAPQSPTPVPA